MLMHLRLIVPDAPAGIGDAVRGVLDRHETVTNVTWGAGQAVRPAGALVGVDVPRESADRLIGELTRTGLADHGAISVTSPEATPFAEADRLDRVAAGEPDDSVVWSVVVDQAESAAQWSWTFHAFLTLATILAGVAVLTDSPVLVVGAMVVGPDFGPVGAVCAGVVLRRWGLVARAARLLAVGYVGAIAAVALLGLIGRAAGVITPDMVAAARPATAFIWRPDLWSLVVAIVAGVVGSLALATDKSSTLVGVFIAVTTVPAAGNLALALATWVPSEIRGSATQLGLNIAGLLVGGVATFLVRRLRGASRGDARY